MKQCKMSDKSTFNTATKVASILFLLVNYALTVNAAPLGTVEMTVTRFYWILLFAVLLVLSLMYYFTKNKSPVQVIGLAYDKTNHKLELTVKNNGEEKYCIKSALRLLQPPKEVLESVTSDGNIPMAQARASVGNRRLFQLLCEDDSPLMLEPKETRTITYDIMLPPEHIKLDASKNVEVHIAYSEEDETPAMADASQTGGADGLCIKMDSGEVIAEVFLLEDLLEAIKKSPDEAINFHMRDGNDFSLWVRNVVGDSELAKQLDSVEYTSPPQSREKLIELLDEKIESLKHPYLRKVNPEKKFYLKSDHDQILSEVQLLEELAETLANSPTDVVSFHTRNGNDFASWVEDAVGDTELAQRMMNLQYTDPDEAKDILISTILERVDTLKC